MTRDEFWTHIEATRDADADEHAERLTERLAKLSVDDILDFEHWWETALNTAYRWDIWGAAYLINGGCSDDGFEYFRPWLVLQGRKVYESAVENPDSLADIVDPDEEVECECYPGADAWFRATGTKRDDTGYKAWHAALTARHQRVPLPELNQDWDHDDDQEVRRQLPRLAALYLDEDE